MRHFISQYKKQLFIGGVTALVCIAAIAAYIYFRSEEEQFVPMSGALYDPIVEQTVAGADLVSGDTVVRTSESGLFSFGSVSTFVGVSLTHPSLLRAFTLLPNLNDNGDGTFYFNTELLNTLVTVVDREARGKVYAIYDHLAPEVKADVSLSDFEATYKPIFTEDNVTDQSIVVAGVARIKDKDFKVYGKQYRFQNVYAFTLENPSTGVTKMYRFVYLARPENEVSAGVSAMAWYFIP